MAAVKTDTKATATKRKRRSKKKKMSAEEKKKHFANGIVILCIITVIVYTGGCMWMKYTRGVEPSSTLTMCFFGVFGVELGSLAGIKMSKIKHERTEEDEIADYAKNHTESEQ